MVPLVEMKGVIEGVFSCSGGGGVCGSTFGGSESNSRTCIFIVVVVKGSGEGPYSDGERSGRTFFVVEVKE